MTREELDDQHDAKLWQSCSSEEHTKISIEYAISEIEVLRKDAIMGFPFADQQRILNWFDNRIQELRNLLG